MGEQGVLGFGGATLAKELGFVQDAIDTVGDKIFGAIDSFVDFSGVQEESARTAEFLAEQMNNVETSFGRLDQNARFTADNVRSVRPMCRSLSR